MTRGLNPLRHPRPRFWCAIS